MIIERSANLEEMKRRHFIASILFLLIAYPLSIGPAVMIFNAVGSHQNPAFESTIGVIYSPLMRFADQSPLIQKTLLVYVSFWLPKGASF